MSDVLSLTLTLHLRLPALSDAVQGEVLWHDAFEPLIGAIHHTPGAKVGLVLGGQLVEEFQHRHPEGIEWIRGLLARDQVELLATPVHEPFPGLVPVRDMVGQLKANAVNMRKTFGVRVRGAWLPWQVWNPVWPKVLDEAGLEYTLVPDRFIEAQGHDKGAVEGVHRTEFDGHGIAILPTDSRVREVLDRAPVKKVLSHLSKRSRKGHKLVHLAFGATDFGLRSGVRPDEANAWFASFIASLVKAKGSVSMLLPGHALDGAPGGPRVYLPESTPRGVRVPVASRLSRYVEADRLHKKMLRVSRLVERAERNAARDDGSGHRPDPTVVLQAQRYLHRAQNGEVYQNRDGGGLASPELRALAYKDLLRAEKTALRALRMHKRYALEHIDQNCDGIEEIVCTTPSAAVVIDPALMGSVTEYSLFPLARNLADTYTRVDEPEHDELRAWTIDPADDIAVGTDDKTQTTASDAIVEASKIMKARAALIYDHTPRACFRERLTADEVTVETVRRSLVEDAGAAFADTPWTVDSAERYGKDALRIALSCDGDVHIGDRAFDVGLSKRYTLQKGGGLDVRWEVLNRSHDAFRALLNVELNLSLHGLPLEQCGLVIDGEPRFIEKNGEVDAESELRLNVGDVTTVLKLEEPARILYYGVESIECREGTWVRVLQGLCVVLMWPVELWGQESAKMAVALEVEV